MSFFIPSTFGFKEITNFHKSESIHNLCLFLGYHPDQIHMYHGDFNDGKISTVHFEIFTANIVFICAHPNVSSIERKNVNYFLRDFNASSEYSSYVAEGIFEAGILEKSLKFDFLGRVLGIKGPQPNGSHNVSHLGLNLMFKDGFLAEFHSADGLSMWARQWKQDSLDYFRLYEKVAKIYWGNDSNAITNEINKQADANAKIPYALNNEFVGFHKTQYGTVNFVMLQVCHYNKNISVQEFLAINHGRYNQVSTAHDSRKKIYNLDKFTYEFDADGNLSRINFNGYLRNDVIIANKKVENSNIQREEFDTYIDVLNNFHTHIKGLQGNNELFTYIQNIKWFIAGSELDVFKVLTLNDAKICFISLFDIEAFKSKECILFRSFILDIFNFPKINQFSTVCSVNDNPANEAAIKDLHRDIVAIPKIIYKDNKVPFSVLLQILHDFDKKLHSDYIEILNDFCVFFLSLNKKTLTKIIFDVFLRSKEELELMHSSNWNDPEKELKSGSASQSLDEILSELNNLIGLDAVKQEINSLVNFIQIQKLREKSGLKSSSVSYHIVFTGNPGTGKTTVARIIAKIYKHLGIITGGHLIETDRSGLIAEYVGHTAIKVNNLIDKAINGILFIDEAYSIAGDNKDDFGTEAVATLIKRMEDDRDKLIVIMAGYTSEMKKFIDTNPGFKSRFNKNIEFCDYTPQEMSLIFESQCATQEYNMTAEAKQKIQKVFHNAFSQKGKSFGNGRFVRNIFEKTLENHANRLSRSNNFSKENLTQIVEDDIEII